MPLSCGLSMFFDEKMLLIALFFVESHVLCHLCPLSSCCFRARSSPSFKTERSVISVKTKTPCSCRWRSTYSHKISVVAFLVSWEKSNNAAASLLLRYFGYSLSSVYCQHSNQALLPYRILVKFSACLGNSHNYDIIHKMRVLCSSFSAP